MGNDPLRSDRADSEPARADRMAEWAALGEWLTSPPLLHKVDLDVVRERLVFVGRARASLAALEADLVGEVARRGGRCGCRGDPAAGSEAVEARRPQGREDRRTTGVGAGCSRQARRRGRSPPRPPV